MSAAPSCVTPLDIEAIRKDFPILQTLSHGKPLVYLDSAASAQKPTVEVAGILILRFASQQAAHEVLLLEPGGAEDST